ncbi:hypothetical protein EV368DRAFT_45910, partial [Lentinula lateritia]
MLDETITKSLNEILDSENHTRPKFCFTVDHPEYDSHLYVIDNPKKRRVPVPIGPAIPRRDRIEARPRYCRLMLMFFKPWRTGLDLRETEQSWEDAFNVFIESCSDRMKDIMENMQLLHECRDSRDDHFASK